MVCLSRPYPFKFFKGCLPQILFGPLLNTFSHIIETSDRCVMIAIGYENQDANLCGSVNRKSIWYDFHTVKTPIRYNLSDIVYA